MQDIVLCSQQIEYKKPIPLYKALVALHRTEQNNVPILSDDDVFIHEVIKNHEISSVKVVKFVGKGSSAVVFETEDGNILKLTTGNHFPLNRPIEDFDTPIFKKGKIGKIRYYFEEKLYQHGLTNGFVDIVRDMIKQKGYKTYDLYDMDIQQIGISKEGKLYLLDPECAKYKTLFHALFDKCGRLFTKLF